LVAGRVAIAVALAFMPAMAMGHPQERIDLQSNPVDILIAWSGDEVPLPDYKVGDFWEYATRGWGGGPNPYNSNGTYASKIEEKGRMKVNGTDIDAYRLSTSSKSYYVSTIQGKLYQSWTNSTGETFSLISDLATANSSGSSVTDTYYMGNKTTTSSLGYTDYTPPYDYYQYPVKENETWNGTSTGWSRTLVGGKWYYSSWNTSFRLHSESWETVTVPAGTFRSLRLRTEPVNGYFSKMWLSHEAQTTVRTESYDGTGTLTGVQELTKFSSSPPDKVPPKPLSVSPSPGATGVGLDIEVRVKFSEAMDKPSAEAALSVQPASIKSRTWSGDEMVAALATLSPSTTYQATLAASAKDAAGNPLDGNGDGVAGDPLAWIFTTGSGGTPTPPKVLSASPPDGATGVALNAKVSVSFDSPMDRPSVESAFSIDPAAPGAFAWSSDSTSITLSPSSPLSSSTLYTIAVGGSARSAAGAALASSFTSRFTTGTATDTERPTVVSFTPADGSGGVALGTLIIIEFSEPMQSSTLAGAVEIAPMVEFKPKVEAAGITLDPEGDLDPSTKYTVTITERALDAAGNALIAASASFETRASSGGGPPGQPGGDSLIWILAGAAVAAAVCVAVAALLLRRRSRRYDEGEYYRRIGAPPQGASQPPSWPPRQGY
jgi:hypothetical protein